MHRFLYIILLFGTLLPVSCSRSGAAIAEMERAEALIPEVDTEKFSHSPAELLKISHFSKKTPAAHPDPKILRIFAP